MSNKGTKTLQRKLTSLCSSWCFLALVLNGITVASDDTTLQTLEFNRDIRPILAENCFYCHGPDPNKRKADLRLDQRQSALDAGALGPSGSLIIDRIHSDDSDLLMPPPDSNRHLSQRDKKMLTRWIHEGATYQTHWAFVAPVQKMPPLVDTPTLQYWPKNSVDNFILAELENVGLTPSPEASRETLIRRLYADLIGLPPSQEEVDEFLTDQSPDAYEQLVDHLLASQHYGERMAMAWLDAARFADSNGFQQDGDTWQWIWRDWVINALNDDMPFDQFSIEQLAGDLLPDATQQQQIATAFNRNHLLNGEGGAIAEEQRFNNLFDRVDTTSTTWLGLTMACAQCHDHKYDPLTQSDYYRLLHVFNQVSETGRPGRQSTRIRVATPFLEVATADQKKQLSQFKQNMRLLEKDAKPIIDVAYTAWKSGLFSDGQAADGKDLPRSLTPLLRKPKDTLSDAEKKKIESGLRNFFDTKVRRSVTKHVSVVTEYEKAKQAHDLFSGDKIPRVMIMNDDKPRETRVLDRGDYLSPIGDALTFAPPANLPPLPDTFPKNRLGLAQWLFLPDHPLTARVQVNRMWQHFFGTGLVKTTEDMGVQSEYPRHLALLDWLAIEFQKQGWSQKSMHKLLLMSATYRQTSKINADQLEKDPENRLHGRASRFRMPAMVLRDWALACSGLLSEEIGGPPVYPYQPDQIWESLAITKERDFTYPQSTGTDLYRRSIYTFWRRTVAPANMFDSANRRTCTVRLNQTCTPLHALTTLNDPTWVEAARSLAERCIASRNTLDEQIAFAFRTVLCRQPTLSEHAILADMFTNQHSQISIESAHTFLGGDTHAKEKFSDPVPLAALSHVCLAILNLDEALTRE
ncbi:MAG: PSD1 and planctomycete cytochrome C domain-containing protein [Planctomycetota bacterium]|nr:PSD1 and planctomycete cytochrome C domain-containing protein [Planctomycetota bacterium]